MNATAPPIDPRLTPARSDLAAEHLRESVSALRYAAGRPYIVTAGITALRSDGTGHSPQLTELLFGERFLVYEDRGGWVWGQSQRDGYVGFAERAAFTPASDTGDPTHMVIASFAHLLEEPDLKSTALALLPTSALLTLDEISPCGKYRHVQERDGWISQHHVCPLSNLQGVDPVAQANRFMGVPYLWGGKTASGIDCSGLVQVALALTGITVPRDSDLQLKACQEGLARPVARHEAQRGDIAFFPGHVGIMLDKDMLLHANATHMAVTADPLELAASWIEEKSDQPFSDLYRLV